MSDFAIEIKDLTKKFENFTLGPINLNIPRGTIVGYIGQNGAGKSTTIKLLLGLLKKDSGSIEVLGESNTSDTEVKNKIGVVFDDLFVPEELNLKNLEKFCSMVYDEWDREAFFQYTAKFKLPEKQLIKSYSRGMRMKLSIAMALSHNAELLLLDEATSGLDPIVRDEILEMLMDFMQDENHSILISSHILSDLEKIADYIAFINDGKILLMEEKDRLEDDYAICMLSNEDMQNLDQRAIIGKRVNSFGAEVLVKRDMVPKNLNMKKPSIEEIMLYFVKGEEK